MTMSHFGSHWMSACLLLAGTAAPGWAHPDHDEITVTGRSEKIPNHAQSASRRVTFADLDLSSAASKKELERRVSITITYLCTQLGETSGPDSAGSKCERDARTRVNDQLAYLKTNYPRRSKAWVPGPAWKDPGTH